MKLPPMIEEPPVEDSPNFPSDEAESAIDTNSASELASRIVEEIWPAAVKGYELLRKGEDLFCRVSFQDTDKVLVFRTNWLGA